MFKNPSFIFDILCTVVWLVLMVRYARKGFLASIVQLSGNLISLLGARQLSAACAGWVFENLLADNAVECFDASGTQQWSQNLDTSPQALLANSKDLLLFSGNTVQKLEAPAE